VTILPEQIFLSRLLTLDENHDLTTFLHEAPSLATHCALFLFYDASAKGTSGYPGFWLGRVRSVEED